MTIIISLYDDHHKAVKTYILSKFCNNVRKRRLCKVVTIARTKNLPTLPTSHDDDDDDDNDDDADVDDDMAMMMTIILNLAMTTIFL